MSPVALGRLLRLSLLPTALADVTVGLVLGAGGRWPGGRAGWLVAASLSIYHGAMALNDWADRGADARLRPERPIPSGDLSAPAALALAGTLIALGVAAAFLADPRVGIWMGAVALGAVAYDLVGRGPLVGPALLALCRFGNLGAGLMAGVWLGGRGASDPRVLAPALVYGAYVFWVSRLGRLEDGEERGPLGLRPRAHLLGAAACLGAVPALGPVIPGGGGLLGPLAAGAVAWPAALGLVRASRPGGGGGGGGGGESGEAWTPEGVRSAMGLALRRLLAFTAASALLLVERGPAPAIVAGLALSGLPLSHALRRVFPPS